MTPTHSGAETRRRDEKTDGEERLRAGRRPDLRGLAARLRRPGAGLGVGSVLAQGRRNLDLRAGTRMTIRAAAPR
jgi:hypothetical protein